MTRVRAWSGLVATLALALVGCAGELTTPGEPLRLLAATIPRAYEGEPFEAALRPTGGLRPYRFSVVDGSLPPGLTIENGRLVGTPTAQGRFAFTVEVQDANLNRTVQRLELSVGPLPPPVVTIDVPTTDLTRPTELRLRLEAGRGWRGAQVLVEWDADAFVLDVDSVRSAQRDVLAVWEVALGRLRVDLAVVGEPLSQAADLLRFTLTPTEAAPLGLDLEVVSTAAGGTSELRRRLGAEAAAPDPSALGASAEGAARDDDAASDDDAEDGAAAPEGDDGEADDGGEGEP
jgi:hypothetical protein